MIKNNITANKIALLMLIIVIPLTSSCVIIAKMGRPTKAEQKKTAEFDLTNYDTGKILIAVRSKKNSRQINRLRYNIYLAVKQILINKEIVPAEKFIDYRFYSDYQNSQQNFNQLELATIGKKLSADTILEVTINSHRLIKLGGTGYYEGNIQVSALLYDVRKHHIIWPGDGFGKEISLGFDVDNTGYEGAMKRLAAKTGHCVTRYLYACSLLNFKIFEENTNTQW